MAGLTFKFKDLHATLTHLLRLKEAYNRTDPQIYYRETYEWLTKAIQQVETAIMVERGTAVFTEDVLMGYHYDAPYPTQKLLDLITFNPDEKQTVTYRKPRQNGKPIEKHEALAVPQNDGSWKVVATRHGANWRFKDNNMEITGSMEDGTEHILIQTLRAGGAITIELLG